MTNPETRAVFGANLRQLIANQDTNVAAFSRELDINRTQLNRYLAGESWPPVDTLARICSHTGTDARILTTPLKHIAPICWPHGETLSNGVRCDFAEAHSNEDCGCPEEVWIMGNIEVTLHLEEDGSGHIIYNADGDQDEWAGNTTGMADLRTRASIYIETLKAEE